MNLVYSFFVFIFYLLKNALIIKGMDFPCCLSFFIKVP